VALWNYIGTKDDFHYFDFHDLSVHERYRVPVPDFYIPGPFPYTNNYKQWRVMPWGPSAIRREMDPKDPMPFEPPK